MTGVMDIFWHEKKPDRILFQGKVRGCRGRPPGCTSWVYHALARYRCVLDVKDQALKCVPANHM